MATLLTPAIYDELLDYLLERATPEEILAFEPSSEAEARAEYLAEQSSAGTLSPDEVRELQQLLHFDRKISVMKAKAALALRSS